MSNCFWACEECGHNWNTMEYQTNCQNCQSPRIWFDAEKIAEDHIEIWPVNEDIAIMVEKGEDDDEGSTLQ